MNVVDMTAAVIAARRARQEAAGAQETDRRLSEVTGTSIEALAAHTQALKAQLETATATIGTQRERIAELEASLRAATSAAADAKIEVDRHRGAAESALKAAEAHRDARHAAELAMQREREARIIAESRPPQVIREPSTIVRVEPSVIPAAAPAPVAAPVAYKAAITGRDPNGRIQTFSILPIGE